MATARTLSLGLSHSPTWQNFRQATLLAAVAVSAGVLIYTVETFVLNTRHRFVENPSDVMMRAFGLAHFWIGWLFLFTSPRLRGAAVVGKLAVLTFLGAGLCAVTWSQGGMRNPLLLMAFYAYFLIHEIRDEANLYVASGECLSDSGRDLFLGRLTASVTLSMMTLLATVYTLHGRVQKLDHVLADTDVWLLGGAAALVALTGVAWGATWRSATRLQIRFSDYRPLLCVYASLAGILAVGSLLGSVGFNFIVLIHVMGWLVFVRRRLAHQSGPTAPRSWWAWLRGTPAGLVWLHLGAALVVLILMALRVHLWERAGFASSLFATSSFHYWTIMHITMAYWRK